MDDLGEPLPRCPYCNSDEIQELYDDFYGTVGYLCTVCGEEFDNEVN